MTKKTENICIECEKKNVEKLDYEKEVKIRGEKFKIKTSHWHCKDCDTYWRHLGKNDYMKEVFRLYREKHNMLQPEEIRELRKKYGFTQGELAEIFGCGIVTISRYERGSLQSSSHENMLKLLREPKRLYKFIENKELKNKEKYIEMIKSSSGIKKRSHINFLEDLISYPASEFTGFLKPSVKKIQNMILFFCEEGLYPTKLNKLLFYSDFKYFKENILSITGIRYKHLQFGPVPEYYDTILELLTDAGLLKLDMTVLENSIKKFYTSNKKPDLSVFSKHELRILYDIEREFKKLNNSEISEQSHKEKAWSETVKNELISYEYAMDLSI